MTVTYFCRTAAGSGRSWVRLDNQHVVVTGDACMLNHALVRMFNAERVRRSTSTTRSPSRPAWESTILDELKALAEYWIFDFREIRTPAAPPASRGGARRQPRRPHVPFGWMEMAGLPLAGLAALLLRERASSLRTSTASRDGCARW